MISDKDLLELIKEHTCECLVSSDAADAECCCDADTRVAEAAGELERLRFFLKALWSEPRIDQIRAQDALYDEGRKLLGLPLYEYPSE